MKVNQDPKTGYLIIDDISDGFEILPKSLYNSMQSEISDLKKQLEFQTMLANREEEKSNKLMLALGALCDRLETVKNAHYLEGFADGAYKVRHQKLNDVGKKLKKDVATFPTLLEDTLTEIKNIVSKD